MQDDRRQKKKVNKRVSVAGKRDKTREEETRGRRRGASGVHSHSQVQIWSQGVNVIQPWHVLAPHVRGVQRLTKIKGI